MRAIATVAGGAGVAVIAALPFPAWVRMALALAWLVHVAADLWRLVRSQRDCVRLRFDAGGAVQIVRPDDCCIAATILPGSVATSRLAWLRLGAADGRQFRELVAGKCPQNNDWRRFRVIWRHLGAGP